MRARRVGAGIGLVAVLAACDSAPEADQALEEPAPVATSQPLPTLPDGWRWESYRDVVVAVPGDWGTTGTSRLSQWCAATGKKERPPAVGRPGVSTMVKCADAQPGEPDPGSLLKNGGTYVVFTGADDGVRTEGDRAVVRAGTVSVVIQAPADLREQIAATVQHREDADHNGCPLTHPISTDPAWRPSPADPAVFTEVSTMTACRYDFLTAANEPRPAGSITLVSSLQVIGERASQTAAAIGASPAGGGPDRAGQCIGSALYGDEAIVVRLEGAAGKPVYLAVRYSGCEHNGIDDGAVVHALTFDSARPFFESPNYISSYSGGPGKTEVLHPESAAGARAKGKAIEAERERSRG